MGRVVKSASGLSLMVGDTVYDENGEAFVVLRVEEPEDVFKRPSVKVYNGGGCGRRTMKPDELFHFKPVKCADERVLKHGQIVRPLLRGDGPFIVDVVIEGFVSCHKLTDPDVVIHISPDGLSHYKSVVDARGIIAAPEWPEDSGRGDDLKVIAMTVWRDGVDHAEKWLTKRNWDWFCWIRDAGGPELVEKKLMPDGMEWPRYEDGELVRFGDDFLDHQGNLRSVLRIDMWQEGGFSLHTGQGTEDWHSAGERVKRPAVLAADGEPLEVGQTVYVIANGKTHHVTEVDAVSKRFRSMEQVDGSHWLDPMCFTHQRPVLDADGVPIKKGDTVYFTDGREQECNTVVNAKYDYKDEPYVQLGRLNEAGYPTYTNCSCIDPSQLTHTKPEPDTWERIEADADIVARLFDHFDGDASEDIRNLVRRCKKLAEKEAV